MKKIFIHLIILIIILLALTGPAFAGSTSYSISVSCTIPAIPGVNVPLVEEESAVIQNQVATTNLEEQKAPEKEDQIEKEQLMGSENGNSLILMLTRTIYSR